MELITRNGICYDFSKSEYRCTINGLTFVFSSKLHLDKFKRKVKENRDIVNYSLSKRFNIAVNVSPLADVVLYKKIESRGFLIVTSEGIELWKITDLKYVGGKVTPLNSNG